MNTKKRGAAPSPRAMSLAFKSFAMEASEKELDEALASEGEDPEALLGRADAAIHAALHAAVDRDEERTPRPALTDQETLALHEGLSALVQLLRRQAHLSEDDLAEAARVDADEIRRIEFDPTYSPSPRTVYQLEEYFSLPERTLVLLSGAVSSRTPGFTDEVLRFTAHSKEIGSLSREEKKLLNKFVRFLTKESKRRD